MVNFETWQIGLLWTPLTQCQRSLEPMFPRNSQLTGPTVNSRRVKLWKQVPCKLSVCASSMFPQKNVQKLRKNFNQWTKATPWLTSPDHPDPIYTAIDASSLSNSSVFSARCDPRAACRRKSAANLLSDKKIAWWRKLQMKLNLNPSPSTFLWTFKFDPNPSWFDLAGTLCDCITVAPAAATQRKPKIWQETYNGRVPQ